MKKIIIAILMFTSLSAFAQNLTKEDLEKEITPLADKVKTLQSESGKLKDEIVNLNSNLSETKSKLDSLEKQAKANSSAINETSKELGLKISSNETNTNRKITAVDESLSKNSLYGIIGVLLTILLSGFLYWLLSKRQKTDKTDFIEQLSKTKSSIEESLVKEFGKQTELMEPHLKLLDQQNNPTFRNANTELDHSFALKVADELTLIERNIRLMDAGTKGLKQLSRSVEKIKDNLAANGYEIPILLGKPFNQGMRIVPVSTIPDENLDAGVEMISKIIKPQVLYNDKMIQAGQIEVSVGY